MQTIRVTIDEDGRARLEVDGVQGKSCEDLTRSLEEFLGGAAEREHKPSYLKEPNCIQPRWQS